MRDDIPFSPLAYESQMEAMVTAALTGHDLTGWAVRESVPGRYELRASCRRCGRSVQISQRGGLYSVLADVCPGEDDRASLNEGLDEP